MILKDLIYIYQLEHYDKRRFLLFAYKNINWLNLEKRSQLEWTARSTFLFSLNILSAIVYITASYYIGGLSLLPIYLLVYLLLLPFVITFFDILISPLVLLQKSRIIKHAKGIISNSKSEKLITIGITGSFGKTSMKNILVSILSEKYSVFTFPGNINTDIGVALYIKKHKEEVDNADVLIVEMGAYKMGEISKLCKIIDPDYSVLTSIGECHLDRFGSLENIASAKFELVNATRKKSFLNFYDKNVAKYSKTNITTNVYLEKKQGREEARHINHLDNFEGISFEYEENTFTTKIIADYIVDFFIIAFGIAEEFGMSIDDMRRGFNEIKPVPHRLEVIRNTELKRMVIDDSYNGNYKGFLIGVDILSQAVGRKIVLTPGIVELSKQRSQEIHEMLAEKYAKNVDLVLLIKTKNSVFIVNKFKELGYNAFKIYKTTKEAHDDLVNVLKNGDTIIFQNDVPDNYF